MKGSVKDRQRARLELQNAIEEKVFYEYQKIDITTTKTAKTTTTINN